MALQEEMKCDLFSAAAHIQAAIQLIHIGAAFNRQRFWFASIGFPIKTPSQRFMLFLSPSLSICHLHLDSNIGKH